MESSGPARDKGAKPPTSRIAGSVRVASGMLALILAFYLIREHWTHLSGWWIYLLLLACPLLHVFGHGSHGHDGRSQGRGDGERADGPPASGPRGAGGGRHH